MIINHTQRWIYVGPPKTGSTTLHRELVKPCFGGQLRTSGVHHDTDIPEQYRDYYIWASVRDPYDRAISLYWHYLRDVRRLRYHRSKNQPLPRTPRPNAGVLPFAEFSFVNFLQQILNKRMVEVEPDSAFFLLPVYGWLRVLPRLDGIVHIEHLDEDFARLPFGQNYKFPRLNTPGYPPHSPPLSPEACCLIEQWASDDFQYGYSMTGF